MYTILHICRSFYDHDHFKIKVLLSARLNLSLNDRCFKNIADYQLESYPSLAVIKLAYFLHYKCEINICDYCIASEWNALLTVRIMSTCRISGVIAATIVYL